jgi:hypothetical protein
VKINFDAIEARLKSLVESSTLWSHRNRKTIHANPVWLGSVEAFLQNRGISSMEELPDSLVFVVAKQDLTDWKEYSISDILQTIFQDSGQPLKTLPQITLEADPELLPGEIILKVGDLPSDTPLDKTASMPTLSGEEDDFLGDSVPPNAFVIIDGLERSN